MATALETYLHTPCMATALETCTHTMHGHCTGDMCTHHRIGTYTYYAERGRERGEGERERDNERMQIFIIIIPYPFTDILQHNMSTCITDHSRAECRHGSNGGSRGVHQEQQRVLAQEDKVDELQHHNYQQ